MSVTYMLGTNCNLCVPGMDSGYGNAPGRILHSAPLRSGESNEPAAYGLEVQRQEVAKTYQNVITYSFLRFVRQVGQPETYQNLPSQTELKRNSPEDWSPVLVDSVCHGTNRCVNTPTMRCL